MKRVSWIGIRLFIFTLLAVGLWLPSCGGEQDKEKAPEIVVKDGGDNADRADPADKAVVDTAPVDKGMPDQVAKDVVQEAMIQDTPKAEPIPENPYKEIPLPDKVIRDIIADAGAPDVFPDTSAGEVVPEGGKTPLPGLGGISGDCNVLDDTEWKSTKPFLFINHIDFGTKGLDKTKLTPGGQKIIADGNLGGNSIYSEVFAYELLHRCELAKLLKTEGKITYKDSSGKKTDILLSIDQRKIGVSVTRAFNYPPSQPYTTAKATSLLNKKLKDIPLSAGNATAQDAWVRSILHVIAYNQQHADIIKSVYKTLDAKVKGKIILFVTVTDGKDDFIY